MFHKLIQISQLHNLLIKSSVVLQPHLLIVLLLYTIYIVNFYKTAFDNNNKKIFRRSERLYNQLTLYLFLILNK